MDSRWSARRKTFIFVIVFFALLVAVGVPAYFSLQQKPDCHNGKRDGDETGVDCGGSCELLCKPETLPIVSKGDPRLLRIASSTYELAILVENPNANGSVTRAPYTFTIYSGGQKSPIKTITGETYVGRASTFALFEGPFALDAALPLRVVFSWDPKLVWQKDTALKPSLSVGNMNLIIASTSAPRLEASLLNRSDKDVENIEAVALLTDINGNLIAAGKTFVEVIPAGVSAPLVFSWPQAFGAEAVSIRILPHVLPDKSYIR